MARDTQAPLRDAAGPRAAQPKISWDTSNVRSSYANVCNVTSTREEVSVMFGLSQAWSGNEEQVTVSLNERVILSPYAAKRLALLLSNVVEQYESRYGALDVLAKAPAPTAGAASN